MEAKTKLIRIKPEMVPAFNLIKSRYIRENPKEKVTDEYVLTKLIEDAKK